MKKIGRVVRENLVTQIKDNIEKRNSTFVVSCPSPKGGRMNEVRKSLTKVGARLYFSRNTIARKALDEINHKALSETIEKQTAFIWSDSDSAEVSKALVKLGKELEGFQIFGGILEGKILQKDDVKRLADLPSRHVLLTMLVTSLQSPLSRLAVALSAKTRDLATVLKQLSEKKGGK